MAPETLLAVAAIAISVIGAIASAGGSVIGFIRGIKKLFISWSLEAVNKVKATFEEYQAKTDRAITLIGEEATHLREDVSYIREDAQEQRREVQEIRKQLNAHLDNEDRHVK